MNNPANTRQQGENARCEGPSFQDLLDLEEVPVPDYLRENTCAYMGDDDLPVDRYISQQFHDLERDKMWNRVWQMACREEDIPEVGDHQLYNLFDRSVIIVRSAGNEIRGFINSCLHRGRLLRDEGGCVNEFRCPFHGATWELDGSFRGIPCQWDFKHLKEKDMNLPQVHVATWGGFVFINFAENPQPFEEYLGVFPEHFSRFPLEDYYKGVHIQRKVNCNWKVGAEAFMESFHTVETHRQILTFTGDANSQYDYFGDHVSRSVTPMGVPSPHLSDISEEQVMRDILKLSGRMGKDSDEGIDMPDGLTARKYVADMNRQVFEEASGEDLSDATMAELEDAILYSLFPNFQVWIGYHGNIVYRFLPDGNNPDRCIFDVMVLLRYPKGSERPQAVPMHRLDDDKPFAQAEELGALGPVFDQDDSNMGAVQAGMKNSSKGAVSLASYQESRIRHFHQTLDKYLQG
ncbi:aromatic ring-hydroxylating oxygenase subunit alpha [Parahaliea aestuarii]|uniref:Aromatic ring-hydroxylating dioxygenase subunit alpha n=1 Tax=Parahaliea aestuarii TaxID=1852021 RepID=A0A5C9A4U5_9GAMM|nr:aromatic ring-hydroxylating dioxygenase subunit alpha [Parahaliea aestuarii]TXS95044.1 aromatic ring-hydroxylating dioxygenase subunit alpha [Parahaliea aestuarii]